MKLLIGTPSVLIETDEIVLAYVGDVPFSKSVTILFKNGIKFRINGITAPELDVYIREGKT